MFAIQQPLNASSALAGLASPTAPLLPDLAGVSLGRLPGATLTAPACDAQVQMLALSLQTNQLLLNMMGMLMQLMENTGFGGFQGPPVSQDLGHVSRGTHHKGGSGASGGSGSSAGSVGSQASVTNGPKVSSPKVQKLIDAALSKQGTPYVFGASGPNQFDCSGLVSWALRQAGSKVGRTTARGLQAHYAGHKISRNELRPGDLVFLWYPNNRGIPRGQASHVEIYLGNGKTMGTDSPKERAKVEPIDWNAFICGARPPELQN
ncbi:C40 family peptidase [bacterium]|nr:C40 family peptidase [bacterium]